ncbi:UDP-phosphate alpha-N-acetyl-D-fucosaminephosphotransferase [Leucobacter sp. CSA1]|uniref:UDP-phosphate alpha-N-acetyl-D-fucosaminephosphotransferase n=1 Tax=Leucobacter chromiisoli TaxID=2796471 RepID=A0A934QAD4_9MICO|nr:UDP-phosphate alpha-N-acetyl-D-fucosaminephosphotransferase [Leucobacter chromiisoli]MBK0419544.1 UDP-phosphate alpha-N-acetyl-D-fucosaminephosphotransferase [Leucobacter chromiisoli]
MSGLHIAVVAGALTLLLSLALPVAVRPLLVRLGIMDVPNERSSHTRPVLRGLGLAVLLAMVAGGGAAVWLLSTGPGFQRWDLLLVVLIGSVLAGLLGLGEDLRGLSVKMRSACLLLLGLLVPVALVLLFSFPPVGGDFAFVAGFQWQGWDPAAAEASAPLSEAVGATPLPLWLGIVLVPYALLFVSSYINVANFMDGLNGISGFHGVIAGLAFAVAGGLTGLPWLTIAGIVIAAAFAGFLPWNLTKPGAFLGDVGSYLLGGAIAITSFAALLAGVPILATIGPMIIYFGDVGVTLVKRVRSGHKWDEPHKEHVYQRIQQLGYSHVQASGMTAGASLLASALGLVSCVVAPVWWLLLLVLGLAVLVLYLALPRLLPASA